MNQVVKDTKIRELLRNSVYMQESALHQSLTESLFKKLSGDEIDKLLLIVAVKVDDAYKDVYARLSRCWSEWLIVPRCYRNTSILREILMLVGIAFANIVANMIAKNGSITNKQAENLNY